MRSIYSVFFLVFSTLIFSNEKGYAEGVIHIDTAIGGVTNT